MRATDGARWHAPDSNRPAGNHWPLTVTPAGVLVPSAASLIAQLAIARAAAATNRLGAIQPVSTDWDVAGLKTVTGALTTGVGALTPAVGVLTRVLSPPGK